MKQPRTVVSLTIGVFARHGIMVVVSVTGYWFSGVVPLDALETLRRDVDPAQFEPTGDADLEWWKAVDHAALTEPDHRTSPSDAASRFAESLMRMRPNDEALSRCLDAFHQSPEGDFFGVGTRKGDPVAALCYGLGFDAARRMPGRFGCFLLDAGGVRTALAGAGQILADPPGGRAAFSERVSAWLKVMSDDKLDPLLLLDDLLRILRRAEVLGMGAVGVMQWF